MNDKMMTSGRMGGWSKGTLMGNEINFLKSIIENIFTQNLIFIPIVDFSST